MTWTVLPGDDAAKTAAALQPTLVDLIDLHLIGKQAHWTVVGERFQSAHERLDVISDGLLQTIIEGLEEELWMLRAHLR